jgi:hypothetical protein
LARFARSAGCAALLGGLLGVVPLAPPAYAAEPETPDLARLADGQPLRTSYQPPGMKERYGRAQVLVNAPMATIHALVLDYGHYKELTGGRFHVSRVIGRAQGGTEVYFQLPVLDGTLTLWQVFRFQELKPLAPGWAMVEGWFIQGNIGQGNAAWTMQAIDDEHTLLTFDLLVVPNVPLPQAIIDAGLRRAAGAAVEAIRNRAQEPAHAEP